MKRPLIEINTLQSKYDCPVVCAGDLFDTWRSLPELVNFALEYLPTMYAIPGQHDLPYHSYEDIRKSAYWTLVKSGKICHIEKCVRTQALCLWGFPWGIEVKPLENPQPDLFHLAVIHAYIWKDKATSYPGASKESKLPYWNKRLQGYNAAALGDNHLGFITMTNSCRVINCGGLLRRKIDEIDYKPQVGLLMGSGLIEPYYLDCSQDKFIDVESSTPLNKILDMTAFLDELRDLQDKGLDFVESVRRYTMTNNVNKQVRKILAEVLEAKNA
jgi:DNA repair exonuclease SbcCD nuclease subunit